MDKDNEADIHWDFAEGDTDFLSAVLRLTRIGLKVSEADALVSEWADVLDEREGQSWTS
jgi:hypothetical protein